MENKPFELTNALATWRERLLADGIAPEVVEELENHLLDSAETLRSGGLSEAESFRLAVERLGNPREMTDMTSDSTPLPDQEDTEPGGCLRSLGGFLLALGIFLLLLGVGGGFMAYFLPKEYLGRCIVAIKQQDSGPVTTKFVATQFQVITSTDALDSVVENTDLANLWAISKEEAREKLEDSIEVENMRGTDLLGIDVRDGDAAVAASLANEIAEEYSRRAGNQLAVIIHEKATPGENPASPSTTMYLIIAVTLGATGLISGILGIVFLCVAPRSLVSTDSPAAP